MNLGATTCNEKPGTIIILNGPSAAEKSSIQKAIQEYADQPFIAIGIDNFFNDVLPDEHGSLGKRSTGNFSTKDIRYVQSVQIKGKEAIDLQVGPIGLKVIVGMHRAIRDYALDGNNIVVDYISYHDSWRKDLLEVLANIPKVTVKISLSIEILEQREQERSTSPVGHSRSHYYTVHNHWDYDLAVDTTKMGPKECCMQILNYLNKN